MSRKNEFYKQALCLGVTVVRYGLAEKMAQNVRENKSFHKELVAFMVADHFDGVLARYLGVDNGLRRGLDAVVDRISVSRVGAEVYKKKRSARPFLAALAFREGVVGLSNFLHNKRTGEVVHSAGLHKADTLSVAAFALSVSTNDEQLLRASGLSMAMINYVTAADYVKNAISPHGVLENGVRHINFELR